MDSIMKTFTDGSGGSPETERRVLSR